MKGYRDDYSIVKHMFKIKNKLVWILSGILFCCFLTGCSQSKIKTMNNENLITDNSGLNNKIEFKLIKFNGSFRSLDGNETIISIAKSKEELVSIFSKYDILWIDKQMYEEINEEYFDKKVIILYFYWTSGSNIERNVDSVLIEDNQIVINLVQKILDPAVDDLMLFYPIVLEISKDSLNDIDDIQINCYN